MTSFSPLDRWGQAAPRTERTAPGPARKYLARLWLFSYRLYPRFRRAVKPARLPLFTYLCVAAR